MLQKLLLKCVISVGVRQKTTNKWMHRKTIIPADGMLVPGILEVSALSVVDVVKVFSVLGGSVDTNK